MLPVCGIERSITMKGKYPVFVYGILKARFQGEETSIKATCYDLGPYPAITKLGGKGSLKGKLIYVDADTLEKFDLIEGVPNLYRRDIVKIGNINAFVYVYSKPHEITETYPRTFNWISKYI